MKYSILIICFFFSFPAYSQQNMQTDSVIDFSNRSKAEEYNRILINKNSEDLNKATLLIVDGIKSRYDIKKIFKIQSKIKNLEILSIKNKIKKYTSDRKIKKVILITTK